MAKTIKIKVINSDARKMTVTNSECKGRKVHVEIRFFSANKLRAITATKTSCN